MKYRIVFFYFNGIARVASYAEICLVLANVCVLIVFHLIHLPNTFRSKWSFV